MRNPWSRFRSLNPDPPLLVGTVQAHLPGGLSRILLPSGATVDARGQEVPEGQRAFVRGGAVEGEAPVLATVEILV